MSLENRESRVINALSINLNQVLNTPLLFLVASKPIKIQRYSVMADSVAGLLVPMVLQLRVTNLVTFVTEDLGTDFLTSSIASPRGFGFFKDLTVPGGLIINAGDQIMVSIQTPAGGTSTGDIALEYWELPFSGNLISRFVPGD